MSARSDAVNLGPENQLRCPHCKNVHMCQVSAEINARTDSIEDGNGLNVGVSRGGMVSVIPVQSKDMPGRRQSAVIVFRCDYCQKQSSLTLTQHKGQTLVVMG